MYNHPQVATRDCSICKQYYFNEDTGEIRLQRDKITPMKRLTPPNCELAIGCPKGHYSKPKVISERNIRALNFYLECRAVNQFPDDPLVRYYAPIIKSVIDQRERELLAQQLALYLLK